MKPARNVLLLALALLTVTSCDFVDKLFHARREVVARVGTDLLYRYEVDALIPQGATEADSIRMAEQYIHSWAFSRLIMHKAESALSKDDKSIDAEVAEFRKNLLNFRYEKHFIESRLDTLVTEGEMQAWFDSHSDRFVTGCSIIRARVVRVSPKSPYYNEIKERYSSDYPGDVAELEELCYASAEKYNNFGGKWIAATTLASETDLPLAECEKYLSGQQLFEFDTSTGHYIVYVISRVAPGQVSPLEYNSDAIHDLIISRRKQDLLISLEEELFEEALANKTFRLYNRNE